MRQAAAHTLTLRAAASLELVWPPSVSYPPVLATGTFDLQGASGQETLHSANGTETLVFQPARIFDRRPAAAAQGLPQGRPWTRADFNEHAKNSPFFSQYLLRMEQDDPGFLLAEVAWGAHTAAPLGPSTVHGIPTNGYLVNVDPTRAAASASGPRAPGFVRTTALLQQALGSGTATLVIRIWVDRSNRVVSLRTSTVANGDGTALITMTSFGIRVPLSPPALSQTVDLAALVGADTDHD